MKKVIVFISYNPYLINTKIFIDNIQLNSKRFNKIISTEMQNWLEKNNNNWNGIIEELNNYVNNDYQILFNGRKYDFEKLKNSVNKYNSYTNESLNIQHIKVKEDIDILTSIESILDNFDKNLLDDTEQKKILNIKSDNLNKYTPDESAKEITRMIGAIDAILKNTITKQDLKLKEVKIFQSISMSDLNTIDNLKNFKYKIDGFIQKTYPFKYPTLVRIGMNGEISYLIEDGISIRGKSNITSKYNLEVESVFKNMNLYIQKNLDEYQIFLNSISADISTTNFNLKKFEEVIELDYKIDPGTDFILIDGVGDSFYPVELTEKQKKVQEYSAIKRTLAKNQSLAKNQYNSKIKEINSYLNSEFLKLEIFEIDIINKLEGLKYDIEYFEKNIVKLNKLIIKLDDLLEIEIMEGTI